MSPALLGAYRRTRYSAGGVALRIGRLVPSALFEWVGGREAVLVTAWNPFSRKMPAGWNARMQRRLEGRLRRFVVLPADGALGRWHEAHLLVGADARRIVRLARMFRQRAVVVLRRGQGVRLVVLEGGR